MTTDIAHNICNSKVERSTIATSELKAYIHLALYSFIPKSLTSGFVTCILMWGRSGELGMCSDVPGC